MTADPRASLAPLTRREFDLHGRKLVCHVGGSGPALLLLHGISSGAHTWALAARHLAEQHTVIALDLPGHGESENPAGDYSLGAFAGVVRDVALLLGVPRFSLVGHSLGGGIALQTAYLFPELIERLVLVSSGGLGSEVHPALRAATLPGSELVLPLLTASRLLDAGDAVGRGLNKVGVPLPLQVAEVWQGLRALQPRSARQAFLATARAVIGPAGQRVSAVDRLHLAQDLPMLIVWGLGDRIIPVAHGQAAAAQLPGSQLELFENSGHFPHQAEPRRFARVLSEFVAATSPATLRRELPTHLRA